MPHESHHVYCPACGEDLGECADKRCEGKPVLNHESDTPCSKCLGEEEEDN